MAKEKKRGRRTRRGNLRTDDRAFSLTKGRRDREKCSKAVGVLWWIEEDGHVHDYAAVLIITVGKMGGRRQCTIVCGGGKG